MDQSRRRISIHAPRTGSDLFRALRRAHIVISIHAPRTGSDAATEAKLQPWLDISIHAPRTGSDAEKSGIVMPQGHFNPRSPHGERPRKAENGHEKGDFNPRSPHGERPLSRRTDPAEDPFQSTLPARGATRGGDERGGGMAISIHAPRTGSDLLKRERRRSARV